MSKMEHIAEKLKAQQKEENEAQEKIALQVRHWPGKVESLNKRIEQYLEPLKAAGVSISQSSTEKNEQGHRLNVPVLKITHGNKTINSDATLFVFGSYGVVELSGSNGSTLAIHLSVNDNEQEEWRVRLQSASGSRTPRQTSIEPFDESHLSAFIEQALL